LVVKSPFWSKFLMSVQILLIKMFRGLFSYQIYMIVRPLATLPTLLEAAYSHSQEKSAK